MSDRSLADELNIDIPDMDDEVYAEITIPENLSLDDIARINMELFSRVIKDVNRVPVQYRARHLEVSQGFINAAKDALHKREDIDIKKEKVDPKKKAAPSEGTGTSRQQLYGVK